MWAVVELVYAAGPTVLMNTRDPNSLDLGVGRRVVDLLRAELDLACEMDVIGFGFCLVRIPVWLMAWRLLGRFDGWPFRAFKTFENS